MKASITAPLESIQLDSAPGVYVPSTDSRMLMEAFADRGPVSGSLVLDVCCGSGVQGIAAARAGHRVVAVDTTSVAVKATRMNASLHDVELEVLQGDLFEPVDGWRFDAVLANPPYVPAPPDGTHTAWCDGGADGRAVIDRICRHAGRVLGGGGKLWLVHSSLADISRSLWMLELAGFSADIVAEQELALGPISLSRREYLTERGYLAPGADREQLAVIEARLEE